MNKKQEAIKNSQILKKKKKYRTLCVCVGGGCLTLQKQSKLICVEEMTFRKLPFSIINKKYQGLKRMWRKGNSRTLLVGT